MGKRRKKFHSRKCQRICKILSESNYNRYWDCYQYAPKDKKDMSIQIQCDMEERRIKLYGKLKGFPNLHTIVDRIFGYDKDGNVVNITHLYRDERYDVIG